MNTFDVVLIVVVLLALQPVVSRQLLAVRRVRALKALERRDGSRAITLIHRQEGLSLLGLTFGGTIDIDDSEAVVRAIEMTSPELPISFVIHAPGGFVLAAEQIAAALVAHRGPVTVYVPHYAMSGGTLVVLAADRIVMASSAVLGPIDPQIADLPAASILAAAAQKEPAQLDDETLILADIARKAQKQVREFATNLLAQQLPRERAADIARILSDGRFTHDYPIDAVLARALGLEVSTDLPDEVRVLMRLYPQPRGRRPSVEYVPAPYKAPAPGPPRAPNAGGARLR